MEHSYSVALNQFFCQGEHIGLLWPFIYEYDVEIGFAATSFKWENNAKSNAGVSCIIVSLRKPSNKDKIIFTDDIGRKVNNINAYLADGNNVIVHSRREAISDIPEMVYGDMPLEGGFLKLSKEERDEILSVNSNSAKFIRKLIGGDSLLKGTERYCLWIETRDLEEALSNSNIKRRIDGVRRFREHGGEVARTLVDRPHQFRYRKVAQKLSIAIPCTSTERREYLPMDIFNSDCILDNSVQALYDPEIYIFGLIASRMHMTWCRAVAGQLETRIRYSAVIVYNNFPVPTLSENLKHSIEKQVFAVLDARENHPEKTLSDMYDPEKMPDDLRLAHQELDDAVDKLYRKKPFANDEERLAYLFSLYEEMVDKE